MTDFSTQNATHSTNELWADRKNVIFRVKKCVLVDLVDNFELGGASFLSRTRWHNESRETKSF